MVRGKPNPWMLCVLGVAVAAFLTDRLLASAGASETLSPSASGSASAAETAEQAEMLPAGPTLAERFNRFTDMQPSDGAAIADAFSPLESEEDEPRQQAIEPSSDQQGLTLSAVLRRDDGNIAVIDGRPLRVGESVGSIRVLSIDAREVRVQTAVGPITLTLNAPSLEAR